MLFENREMNVQEFFTAVYHQFDMKYPKFYKMDYLCKLGWLTAEILLQENHLQEKYKPEETGVILCNASSSLDTDVRYFETTKSIASPALFVYTLPNIMTGEICIRHGFKGENAFFIFEQFDAGFIQQYVNNLIINNTLQVCICGWVELLQEKFRAILMLVEKKEAGYAPVSNEVVFSTNNILKIYQTENG